tara:strand:+ start:594 stop:1256 length:663 start_codon:yes stop_codon:yes gene_type:complete
MNFTYGLSPEEDLRQERLYRHNRTSNNHFLNVPRGLPLLGPRLSSTPIGMETLPTGPNVGLQVFNTIHNAVARAERRLLVNPQEPRNDSHRLNPISMIGQTNTSTRTSNLFPQQGAPVEFTCGVCINKITTGTPQQILVCGHKFCADCFNKWHQQQRGNTTCPTCRTPVYNSSMNQPPSGRGVPAVGMRTSPITNRDLRGTQRLTSQEQALALLLRGTYH